MKKIIVSALAIASLVACTKEEIVKVQAPYAIEYEGAYVDAQTRAAVDPSTTTATIAAFNAYGFMDQPSGVVFNAEDVTKVGGAWSYANTQYWMPAHTYYFAALAPMDSQNWTLGGTANKFGAGEVTFVNVDGTEDLLYAATSVTTPAEITAQPDAVKFAFSHLLSKVKFTFTNGFLTDNMSVIVSDVKMTAPASGSIDLAVENWWDNDDWKLDGKNVELAFGNVEELAQGVSAEVANERLTIPAAASQVYDITFKVTVKVGDVVAIENEERKAQVTGVALEMGKAYNFQATLDHSNVFDEVTLYPITFEVTEVKEWVNAETPDSAVAEAELRAAMQLGGTVKLTEDVVLTSPLTVPAGVSTVIDLNGKKIINSVDSKVYGEGEAIIVYGDLTINGEGTVQGATRAIWARGTEGAVVTINGGTYKGAKEGFAEGGCSVIYASSGNTINIYGGEFEALAADKTSYANKTEGVHAALNIQDNNGYINVYGGKFIKFNPALPGTEPKAWNDAHPNGFVANGYTSVADGDNFTVKAASLKVSGELKDMTIEVTYAPENTASTYGVVCPEGDTKISNVTINGNGFQTTNGKGLRAIYITKAGNYEFDNVTAVNVTYAINVNTTQPVSLTVKNSTLEGWTSYGKSTDAYFENVKFTCGKYANFKPYTEVTLKGCDFADGFKIDVTELGDGKVHLQNCTYKGVAISESNMPAIDGDAAKVLLEGIF